MEENTSKEVRRRPRLARSRETRARIDSPVVVETWTNTSKEQSMSLVPYHSGSEIREDDPGKGAPAGGLLFLLFLLG